MSMEEKAGEEKRKLRMMLIGRIAAGKTSLCQRLKNEELTYHKTQAITVEASDVNMIDTPGEYLERRMFRGPLMVTSMQSDLIVLVQAATDSMTMFPPNFSGMFPKPSIGIVTKCDIAEPKSIENAVKYLSMAGIESSNIFKVSNVTEEGIGALKDFLERFEEENQDNMVATPHS